MKTCVMVTVAVMVVVGTAARARADKPTHDETKPAFAAIGSKLDAEQLATPFLYDLAWHEDVDAKGPCEKKWKDKGTLSAAKDLPAFTACLKSTGELAGIGGKDMEWGPLDLKKIPKPFAKYKSALTKRAKDHLLLVAIVPDAGPAAHYYIAGATKTAGKVQLDLWFHTYDDY